MKIGLPKEIKDNEYRVGLTPAGVRAFTDSGHNVVVETNAGAGSGFEDDLYVRAGATILGTADEVWAQGDMIVKVKEPIKPEKFVTRAACECSVETPTTGGPHS